MKRIAHARELLILLATLGAAEGCAPAGAVSKQLPRADWGVYEVQDGHTKNNLGTVFQFDLTDQGVGARVRVGVGPHISGVMATLDSLQKGSVDTTRRLAGADTMVDGHTTDGTSFWLKK